MPDFLAQVALGESLVPIGQLRFTQAGPRQYSTLTYEAAWTQGARAFAIQPDLSLESGLSMRPDRLAICAMRLLVSLPTLRQTAGAAGCSNALTAMVFQSSSI